MNKKEIEQLIKEYKSKYLYQRYNGKLFKYEIIKNNTLIELKTGANFDLCGYAMLGKISNNIIDLVEVGDYVNGVYVDNIENCINEVGTYEKAIINEIGRNEYMTSLFNNDIKSIVTKEMYRSVEYRMETN